MEHSNSPSIALPLEKGHWVKEKTYILHPLLSIFRPFPPCPGILTLVLLYDEVIANTSFFTPLYCPSVSSDPLFPQRLAA